MKRILFSTLIIAVIACIVPFIVSPFGLYLSTEILIWSILAMSLGILLGYAGLYSLGHAVFYGLGAYTVGIMSQYVSNTYLIFLVAIIVAAIFALISGFISIRNKGIFFLMMTLAISQVVFLSFSRSKSWGGNEGLRFNLKPDFGFGEVSSPIAIYFMVAVFFVLSYLILRLFVDSPFGKALKGIMHNEHRMLALGYNVNFYKLTGYVLAGVLGSIAGVLAAYKNMFVSPELFALHVSTEMLIMVFIGGLGTLVGPIIGAGTYVILVNYVSSMTERWPLIMGVLFIAIVLFAKGGIVQVVKSLLGLFRVGKRARKDGGSQ